MASLQVCYQVGAERNLFRRGRTLGARSRFSWDEKIIMNLHSLCHWVSSTLDCECVGGCQCVRVWGGGYCVTVYNVQETPPA
jgi:hypothetical protein